MADNPKLDICGLDENSGTQTISLLDHVNGFSYNSLRKSDNFVIDMDTFSHGINKDANANSRITMQKSLSRKGSQRGGGSAGAEKMSSSNVNANDRDCALVATSTPRGTCMPERLAVAAAAAAAAAGSPDHSSSHQVHHQITITTGNIITTPDSKSGFKRNSLKRYAHSWTLDPKRVLLIFATLSSMGTILLIYLTLSLKYRADENTLDHKS